MALNRYVGDFRILTTDSGNKDITWTGGFQPDFILFIYTGIDSATDDDDTGDLQSGVGLAIDSSNAVCSITYAQDNVGTTVAKNYFGTTSSPCIMTLSSSAITGSAALAASGWPSTGFRLNITDAFPNNMYVQFVALGGSDFSNWAVGNFATSSTSGTPYNIDVPVGFDPDGVICVPSETTALNSVESDAMQALGFGTEATNEIAATTLLGDGGTSTDADGYCYNGEWAALRQGSSVDQRMNYLGNVVTNNFRVSVIEQSASADRYYLYAAFKMGTGASAYLDVFNTSTSTTNIVRTGYGGQPAVVICFSGCEPNDTQDTSHQPARLSIGAASATGEQGAHAFFWEDSLATCRVQRSVQYDGLYVRPKWTAPTEQQTTVDYTGVKNANGWQNFTNIATQDSNDTTWPDTSDYPSAAGQMEVDDAPTDHNGSTINTVQVSIRWNISASATRAKNVTVNWRKSDATLIHSYTTPNKDTTGYQTNGDSGFVTPTGTTSLTDTEWDASYIEIIADEAGGKGDTVDTLVDYVKIDVKYDDNTGGAEHDGVMKLVSFDSGGATYVMNTGETDNAANQVAVLAFIPSGGDLIELVPETLAVAETIAKSMTIVRLRDEAVNVVEAVTRSRTMARVRSELLWVNETVNRLRARVRSVAETVQVNEDKLSVLSIVQLIAETINVNEVVARARSLARAITEVTAVDETILRTLSLARVVDESIWLIESTLYPRTLARIINEAIWLNEDITYFLGGQLLRVIDETINVVESITRSRTLARIIDELIYLIESPLRSRVMIRLTDEAVWLNEVIVRTVALLRLRDETVAINETRLSVLGISKVIAETLSLIETPLFSRALARVISELLELNETFARSRTLSRLQSELVYLNEVVIRSRALARIENEVIDVNESILRSRTLARIVSETMWLLEANLQTMSLVRLQDEQIALDETTVYARSLVRMRDELIWIVESGGEIYKKIIGIMNDVIAVNETILKVLTAAEGLVQIVSETIDIVEVTIRSRTLARSISETIDIVEVAARSRTMARSYGEIIDVIEANIASRGMTRLRDESVAILEAVLDVKGFAKVIDEVININETTVRTLGLARVIAETIDLLEATFRARTLNRIVSEAEQIIEAVLPARNWIRVLSDVVGVVETIVTSRSMARIVDELIWIVEDINYTIFAGILQIINEVVDVNETIVRAFQYGRIIDETVAITEIANRSMSIVRSIDEAIWLNEQIVKVLGGQIIKVIDEAAAILETITRSRAIVRLRDEIVGINETIGAVRGLARIATETIALYEQIKRARSLNRIIDQIVGIVESVTTAVNIIRFRAELVGIVESPISARGMVRAINETIGLNETAVAAIVAFVAKIRSTFVRIAPASLEKAASGLLYKLPGLKLFKRGSGGFDKDDPGKFGV